MPRRRPCVVRLACAYAMALQPSATMKARTGQGSDARAKHPLVQGQGPDVLGGDEEASLRPARIEHLGDVALGRVRGAPGCLNDDLLGHRAGAKRSTTCFSKPAAPVLEAK